MKPAGITIVVLVAITLIIVSIGAYNQLYKKPTSAAPATSTSTAKPQVSASWRWFIGKNVNITTTAGYSKRISGSNWTPASSGNATTPVAADKVLGSDGVITFPVDGVYSVSFTILVGCNGPVMAGVWWGVITGFGQTNNTKTDYFKIGSNVERHEAGDMTASFTGTFKAGDKIQPTLWADGPVFVPPPDDYHLYSNMLNVTLINAV